MLLTLTSSSILDEAPYEEAHRRVKADVPSQAYEYLLLVTTAEYGVRILDRSSDFCSTFY